MAGRTLLVMEGGHPWGFRIEGGAEVREPVTIQKVLGGGKAYSHGIEEGDVLISINGEKASSMTISRARHLIRTSDDLLVLEVARPRRVQPSIPEIRVVSPSEHLVNGKNQSWIVNEESGRGISQRNFSNTAMDKFGGNRPSNQNQLISSSRPSAPGSRPIPPPKPPLAMRSPRMTQWHEDVQRPMKFTSPISPLSPVMPLRGKDPGVLSPPGGMSANQSFSATRQSSRTLDTRPHTPRKPDHLKSSAHPGNVGMQSVFSVPRRNTEPAPIKPGGYDMRKCTGKMADYDDQWLWLKKADPVDMKPFRYGTTDAGPMGPARIDRSSTRVSLPLSPTRKQPSVSEDQFEPVDLFIREDPYDLLPSRHEKVLHFRGESHPMINYQNPYNTGKSEMLRPSQTLKQNWPRKFEMPEAGYDSMVSHVEPNVYPDYEYLPSKRYHQEDRILSPESARRNQIAMKEHIVYPGPPFQRVTARQKLDGENLRRKLEIERVISQERQRRLLKDQMANSARRHTDNFSPTQRRSLITDRFSDDEVAEALARPVRRVCTKIRGKARALHSFRAQSSRELSLKRNDIVYILRQIDKNWFEGERNGLVGIFPITYVEVITSLDEAKATAILREGAATAIYNFKTQTGIEMPLRKGDLVTLIRRVDENWYEGRIGRRQGIFPVTYVEIHREPDTPMVTPMSSLAPTPVPGTPICQSPVSSIYSAGPEIPSAPMSPLDSEFYESDWDTESIGALQGGYPLRTSRPTSPAYSDREVTPVRAVTSPVPNGATIRAVTSPPPSGPSMRAFMSSVHSGASVRSVSSPVPSRSTVKGIALSVPRTVLSPVPNDLPLTRQVTSPPPSGMPVRNFTSPVLYAAGDSRISVDGCKVLKPSVPPKSFTLPSNQNLRREVEIDAVPINRENNNKLFDNSEQRQQTKSATVAKDPTTIKSDPTKQRPPSGRPASLTLKATKPRSGTKQESTEVRDRRDGFSKSPRSHNPYMRYRAVYNYKPQNIDELELNRGDIIFVMEKCADGWHVGISDRTKQFGTFPGNFVRPM